MNAFDYSGSSKITKELAKSHSISKNASKSVNDARTIEGRDPGTIYGISRVGDDSVMRFNALRAMQLSKSKLQVKLQHNKSHGERHGNKKTQSRRANSVR
jgi:hypothetical protein